MAKYTTELLTIVKHFSTEGLSLNERIDEANQTIFDFLYPIWDDNYRNELNRKIIRHYLRQEISFETYFLWKQHLESKMFEIMPYYNKIYLTTLEDFEGTSDVDITTTIYGDRTTNNAGNMTENSRGTSTENVNNTGESTGKDYPQATVTATDALYYASQGQSVDNNTNTESESSANRATNTNNDEIMQENRTQTRKGKSGLKQQGSTITSFRNTIINIDMMVINELQELFMMLW